jgi:hypothetical protein
MGAKIKRLFQTSGFQSIVKMILSGLMSILVGQAISKLFNKEWVFFLVFGIVFIIFIVFMFIIERFEINFNILKIISKDLKDKRFKSVVRLAYPLSRPLWVAGKYDLRIKIGRQILLALNSLMEDTVLIDEKKISVEELKAKVLMDDLGWTIFRINPNSYECIANIERGIIIAKKEQLFSLAIKGHRHLIGIYSELKNDEKIKENIEEAKTICSNENYKRKTSVKERESVLMGLDYALLKISIEEYQNQNLRDRTILDDFIKKIEIFSNYYKTEEDWERYAKTFYVHAEILILYDSPSTDIEAESVLLEGLNVCDAQARIDGFIRVSMMLMEIQNKRLLTEKDKEEKTRLINEFKNYHSGALKRAKEINNKEHIGELRELMQNIGKK